MELPSRADVLLHPVRLRIVQTLMLERPMSVAELGEALGDVPQASLYRHVRQLTEAGFVEAVDSRPVGGAMEQVYSVVAEAVTLGEADLTTATRADHMRYFTAFCATLMGTFERYLQRDRVDLAKDGVGYRTVPVWLSDEEFYELITEMNRPLRAVVDNKPAPGRSKRMFASVVVPVGAADGAESEEATEDVGVSGAPTGGAGTGKETENNT